MTYYVATYDHNYVIGVFDTQEEAECACKIEVTRRKGWQSVAIWETFAKVEKVSDNTIDYIALWNDFLKSISAVENRQSSIYYSCPEKEGLKMRRVFDHV